VVWKRSSLIEVNLFYVSMESFSDIRKQCFTPVAKFVLIGLHMSVLIFLSVSGPKI
jgi:hypothetical protein